MILIIFIIFFLNQKECRVWIPNKEEVWKCASVSKKFTRGDKQLHLIDEDGNVRYKKINFLNFKRQRNAKKFPFFSFTIKHRA